MSFELMEEKIKEVVAARRSGQSLTKEQWEYVNLVLANAYLREHPVDDDEPVTEEWYFQVGFEKLSETMLYLGLTPVNANAEEVKIYVQRDCQTHYVGLIQDCALDAEDHVVLTSKEIKTRGDVRRLCRALGIELKESE